MQEDHLNLAKQNKKKEHSEIPQGTHLELKQMLQTKTVCVWLAYDG